MLLYTEDLSGYSSTRCASTEGAQEQSMAFEKNQRAAEGTSDEADEAVTIDHKRYGRLLRMYRAGYLSVCVYKNVYRNGNAANRVFYDIVIYRKIRLPAGGGFEYRRGCNLKPTDLKHLAGLIAEADEFLQAQLENPE